jgi:hypothetical protein
VSTSHAKCLRLKLHVGDGRTTLQTTEKSHIVVSPVQLAIFYDNGINVNDASRYPYCTHGRARPDQPAHVSTLIDSVDCQEFQLTASNSTYLSHEDTVNYLDERNKGS